MKKYLIAVVLLFSALLIGPMMLSMLYESERRHLVHVSLEDTVYREIAFPNNEQDLQLAGMLFVPEGIGPFPVVVIIHGSGTSRRDNGWYLTLVRHLQDNGLAVLLPDKRGSEQSAGDWRTASFDDLATDTLAAIDFLAERPDIAVPGIGVIGLSQGGQIAPLVARRSDRLSFVVNIVGGAVPMHEQLVYEENHNLRQMGMLPGFSNLFARLGAWSLIRLRQKEFWDSVGNFDSIPYWREVTIPTLILYGENDTNVPSKRSAEALRSLGNPNIEVLVYQGSGHALESPEGSGNSIFRRDALDDILAFINARSP